MSWTNTSSVRPCLEALVAQDVRFFDDAQAGELSAATSEKVQAGALQLSTGPLFSSP